MTWAKESSVPYPYDFHFKAPTLIIVGWNYPETVDEAVERLLSELPLKDKVYIASLAHKDLCLWAQGASQFRWYCGK